MGHFHLEHEHGKDSWVERLHESVFDRIHLVSIRLSFLSELKSPLGKNN